MSNLSQISKFPAFLFSFLIFFCFVISAFSQDDDIIRVESSIVVLNAVITDDTGKAVTSLKESKFKVFEDGIEQKVQFFETQETPFAAVILIDTSGSMTERISMARSAAINFLDGLRAGDSAAIFNFDSKVSLVQEFSGSRDVAPGVFDLKADGMTVLNDAVLRAAQELNKRAEKRKAVIVISDGADTKSRASTGQALKAALAAAAIVYTVDMSSSDSGGREKMQSQGVLKNFAEKTGGFFIPAPGGAALRGAFKKIVEELGAQYTLGYQPSNLKKDGKWRAVELKISQPNLTIRTRKGYNAPKDK